MVFGLVTGVMNKLSQITVLALSVFLLGFSSGSATLLSDCFQECKLFVQDDDCCKTSDEDKEGCCGDESDCCEVEQGQDYWNISSTSNLDHGFHYSSAIEELSALLQPELKPSLSTKFHLSNAPPPTTPIYILNSIWLI